MGLESLAHQTSPAQELGIPIRMLAYPFGKFLEETSQVVVAAGYEVACRITPSGYSPCTSLFALNRLEIQGTDSIIQIAPMLIFGNDAIIRRRSRIYNHGSL